jgi:EAL domain-containing protein (putative c-di-GMP-specific phosphodiesterase class I)
MRRSDSIREYTTWHLEGVLNDARTLIIPIFPLPFQIGRHKSCQLSISEESISRYHAEIFSDSNFLWIRDLGSTNGTFVNGQRLEHGTVLKSGDVLHFGHSEFRVIQDDLMDLDSQEKTICSDMKEDQSQAVALHEESFCNMLNQRAVIPYFQPIIQLSDESICGYEVLGRGNHQGLPINPLDLFRIATELNLETQLSDLFRQEGVLVARDFPGSPNIFVNTHPIEISQETLLKSMRQVREFEPSMPLTLEIHEKAITDLNWMKYLKSGLAELDIRLAYDDFGAGQARFIELIEVPPDYLKFDICLIRGIHTAPKRFQQVVKTLVKMAQDLGIAALAEGVEYKEESDKCAEIGFSYAQGYYFSRPAPINDFFDSLA